MAYHRTSEPIERDDSTRPSFFCRKGPRSIAEDVALAELLYLRGYVDRADTLAKIQFESPSLAAAHRGRLLSVVAAIQSDRGDLEAAVATGRKALEMADESNDSSLSTVVSAQLLERSCDRTGFDVSLPLASQVRKRAVRCTDVQTRATVHLTFGRLEGRVGHLRTALRHFAVGRQLVAMEPNDLITASIDLDESSVLFLLGDVPAALEMAQKAERSADQSGWAKGKTVAILNVGSISSLWAGSLMQMRRSDTQRSNYFGMSLMRSA